MSLFLFLNSILSQILYSESYQLLHAGQTYTKIRFRSTFFPIFPIQHTLIIFTFCTGVQRFIYLQVMTTSKPVILQSATYGCVVKKKKSKASVEVGGAEGVIGHLGREQGTKAVAGRQRTSWAGSGHGGSVPLNLLAAWIFFFLFYEGPCAAQHCSSEVWRFTARCPALTFMPLN